MSFWNKITIGTKFLFGRWESALNDLLTIVNDYLAKPEVAHNAKKVYDTAKWAFGWLCKLESYVPAKWYGEYTAIQTMFSVVVDIAEDGKLTYEEIDKFIKSFHKAKAEWDKED